MIKLIKGKKYTIEVDGEMRECEYLGKEFGEYVFEIVGTTTLIFKKNI